MLPDSYLRQNALHDIDIKEYKTGIFYGKRKNNL
jgi:hypothetical protein